MTLKVSYMI